MTVPARGTPPLEPLDLVMIGEVIARIDAERMMGGVSREMQARHYLAMRSHAGALLALLRETRAALSRYVVASAPSSPLVDQGIRALAQAVEEVR